MHPRILAASLLALAVSGGHPAWATTSLYPATLTAFAVSDGILVSKTGPGPQSAAVGPFSASAAAASGVALRARGSGAPGHGGQSVGEVDYQFEIVGGPTAIIPVWVQANLDAYQHGVGDFNYAFASLKISPGEGGTFSWLSEHCDRSCVPMPNQHVSSLIYVLSNMTDDVFEQVAVTASGLVSRSAFADPYFYIDPGFLANNPGYRLVFSSGVANVPVPLGVPEPATWVMMLAGVGLAGTVLRRRRSRARAAA